MLKLLSANLATIKKVRDIFSSHDAFNVHPTTSHTEADPFPDQLKGMWFCLKEGFFKQADNGDSIRAITNKGEVKGKVSMTLVNVYGKGKSKVLQNFGKKLFNSFHVNVKNNEHDDA
jgi:hypothetical protein